MDLFNFEDVGRFFDDVDEMLYGKRPRGTKRNLEGTVQELTLSEMTGLPIKIKK